MGRSELAKHYEPTEFDSHYEELVSQFNATSIKEENLQQPQSGLTYLEFVNYIRRDPNGFWSRYEKTCGCNQNDLRFEGTEAGGLIECGSCNRKLRKR